MTDLIELLGDLVIRIVQTVFALRRRGRARRGMFLSAIRTVSGAGSESDRQWRAGYWRVTPGRLELGGIRFDEVTVESASLRPATARERVGGVRSVIVLLRAPTRVFECSVPQDLHGRMLAALGYSTRVGANDRK